MFVAWLMTISLFVICYYSTVTIMNGIKEKDQQDLALLHAQMENKWMMKEEVRKKAV